MDDLNYHHLHYFWVVAKEGSIAKAAVRLKVTQPAISMQLKRQEDALQLKLFRKRGRSLELTPTGRQVFEYADRIFAIGRELSDVLHGRPLSPTQELPVGVQTGLPAEIVDRLLRPALHWPEPVRLTIASGELLSLVGELTANRLKLVLSLEPLEAGALTRATCRPLADAVVLLSGREELLQRYRRGFPKSLEQAPLLWPAAGSLLRRQLDAWFAAQRIAPAVVAESDEPSVLALWAAAGHGLWLHPQIPDRSANRGDVSGPLGPLPGLSVRVYGIARDEPLGLPVLAAVLPPRV